MVDIAEGALLGLAKVLAVAKDRQVNQVAPFNHRGDFAGALALRRAVFVELGHRRKLDFAEAGRAQVERGATAVGARRDPVGRLGIHAHGYNRRQQIEVAAADANLLGDAKADRLVLLVQRDVGKRKDKIVFLFKVDAAQRLGVEVDAQPQNVLLEDRLKRDAPVRLLKAFQIA